MTKIKFYNYENGEYTTFHTTFHTTFPKISIHTNGPLTDIYYDKTEILKIKYLKEIHSDPTYPEALRLVLQDTSWIHTHHTFLKNLYIELNKRNLTSIIIEEKW